MGPILGLAVKILFSLALVLPSGAIFSAHSNVELLTPEKYQNEVLQSEDSWLLEFYQPACEPCKLFAPEFSKIADTLRGIIKVGALDCHEHAETCAAAHVAKLPTIRVYEWGRKRNPYTNKWYKNAPVEYTGKPRAKAISDFATELLPYSQVHNLSSSELSEFFFKEPTLAKVILISEKEGVAPLYRALSLYFKDRLHFAQVKSSDDELVSRFGATDVPALIVQKTDGEQVKYDGDLKALPIREFLEQFAAPREEVEEDEVGGEPSSGEKTAKRRKNRASKGVDQYSAVHIDGSDFEKMVLQSEAVWIVAFKAQSTLGSKQGNFEEFCSIRWTRWEKAAASLEGQVSIGQLDVTTDPQAAKLAQQYGLSVTLLPLNEVEDLEECISVVIFPFGDDKDDYEVYKGELESKALSKAALASLPPDLVTQVTDKTIDEFAGQHLLKPKIILFSNKPEVPGMFKALSVNFRKHLVFGQVAVSEPKLMEEFGVTQLPAVRFMVPNPSEKWQEGKVSMSIQIYNGPLKYKNIAFYLQGLVESLSQLYNLPSEDVDAPEVETDEGFEAACGSTGRLCVVTFVKGADSSSGRGGVKDLENLMSLAGRWAAGGQYSFLWVDPSKSPGFAAQLGVTPSTTLPAVVMMSPRKKRYAIHDGDFSFKDVNAFLEGLLSGKVKTLPLEELPSFSAASTSAASQEESEAEEEILEEEFNLEDILQEEVEDSGAIGSKSKRLEEVERELAEEAERRREQEAAAESAAKRSASGKSKKKKKRKTTKSKAAKEEL